MPRKSKKHLTRQIDIKVVNSYLFQKISSLVEMPARSQLALVSSAIVLLLLINTIDGNEQKVTVHTTSGKLVGRVETPVDGIKIHAYRGIPYAKPPVGELRFRRPLPIEPSAKEIDTSQFQSACYQNLTIFAVGQQLTNKQMSEDCLFLNVWTPHKKGALKSVMVWIHGGGLLVGGSAEWYYHGEVLAAKGDVVVVSINYRSVVISLILG